MAGKATATAALFCLLGIFSHAFAGEQFEQLPIPVKRHAEEVRAACRDANSELEISYDMAGISDITIEGQPAFIVDDGELCSPFQSAGVNCSNRGCDLRIWKRTANGHWSLILEEHSRGKFISATENGTLAALVITVGALHPQCHPEPDREYVARDSCDLLGRYTRGKWRWQRLN